MMMGTANRRSNPAPMSEASIHAQQRSDGGVAIRHRGCATFPDFVLVQVYVVFSLFGAVGAVAGVSKTRKNVGVFVQPLVDRGEPDRNVWVNATHALDTFRRADKAHQTNVVRAALVQSVDRREGGVRRCRQRRE